MDPRETSDVQATGTMPLSGQSSVPVQPRAAVERERPAWVREARAGLSQPGKFIVYEEFDQRVVTPLNQEWTRVGRSLAADIRFDDATVSRRHALVVSQAEGVRVLDDRSLNGVYVNGERVEWAPLTDGDEVTIGRHSLFFLDTATVGSASPQAAMAAE
jgi:pSer/pThr/pTyr-binding forkhead associated (FHA) protein